MAGAGPSSASLFAALGLPRPTADPAAVRAAYVAFSKAHHPDKKRGGGGGGAAFAAAAAAFAALADPAALARHAAAAEAEAAAAAGPVPAVAVGRGELDAAADGGFFLACRCGGSFLVRPADLAAAGRAGAVLAPCDGCSAVARVAVAE